MLLIFEDVESVALLLQALNLQPHQLWNLSEKKKNILNVLININDNQDVHLLKQF